MDFSKLLVDLSSSLASRSGILTEDTVRYYLYHHMLFQDPDLNHYTLELPYDSIRKGLCPNVRLVENHGLKTTTSSNHNKKSEGKLNQELDMYYDNGFEQICVEVKFHRHAGNGSDFAHTMAAGQLINDFRRLQLLRPAGEGQNFKSVMFYVTDNEMHNYLMNIGSNPSLYRGALSKLYNEGLFSCQIDDPETFRRYAYKSFSEKKSSFKIISDIKGMLKVACPGCYSICTNKLAEKGLYIKLYEISNQTGDLDLSGNV